MGTGQGQLTGRNNDAGTEDVYKRQLSEEFILRHRENVSCEDILSRRELSVTFYKKLLELEPQEGGRK